MPFGKFSLPTVAVKGKFDTVKFVDGLAEGILNRLVRAQLTRALGKRVSWPSGPDRQCVPLDPQRAGRPGDESKADEIPKVLSGISVSPREEHDRSGERGSRQEDGTEERDEGRGDRPERALSEVGFDPRRLH